MNMDKSGEIMNLNWNRMAVLTRLKNKTELDKEELDMRIAFQNKFANSKTDEEREKVVNIVKSTLFTIY